MSEPIQRKPDVIRIRGARTHNLRGVDVDVFRNQLTVVTGPSGSGKSSLAFDVLHAEGQRRFIESQSASARQFLTQLERPDVDSIEGLPPTSAIDQRAVVRTPRATAATISEIYDFLRVLAARAGEAFCYRCDAAIQRQSPDQILDAVLQLPERTKCMLLAPMARGKTGAQRDVLASIRKAGFLRARVNGTVHELDAVPDLDERATHQVDAVVDRIVIRQGVRGRLAESRQLTLKHGDGLATLLYQVGGESGGGEWKERVFSVEYACRDCGVNYEELEPRTFSF
ncbi:MAG: excinuclease ABC subunit A, partial [Planctomycetales bacterium]